MANTDVSFPLFLSGGGRMGELIRAYDWSETPLGAPDAWPQALQTLVSVILCSQQPMFIAWGPRHTSIYNDAYSEILGAKHPAALGHPFLQVWNEIADDLLPIVEQAYNGQPVHMDDITLMMERHGYREETHFSFSYTPVRDDSGDVCGFFCPCIETTSQVLTERRIKEENERQRQLFELAPGFIAAVTGPDHVFEFVNEAYRKLVGRSDLVGRTVREALPEIAGQGFLEWLDEVYGSGERVVQFEVPVRLRRGPEGELEQRYVDFIYEPVINDAGQVTGVLVEGHDVTNAHLAQEALKASEAQFEVLAQAMPNMVWTARPDGRIDWFNERAHQYTGLENGALTENVWAALIHPADFEASRESWLGALTSGTPYEDELRIRRHDGEYRWHLSRGLPIYGDDGLLLRWIGANTDIHDQKLAEETLRELNETLERRVAERTVQRDRVWRNSRDLLCVVNIDGTLRSVNPAWTDILGYEQAELEGRSFLDFVWPDDFSLSQSEHDKAANENLTNFENRFRHRDGSVRWISWHTYAEADAIYGYGRHISAEKEQAEALRHAEEQLRHAQKMEAIGQLTGGLAHDFNNILTGIIGSLELMLGRIAQGKTESLARYCMAAMGSAQRAASLTHRLLAFARRQPLDPKQVDSNKLLLSMEDLLRRTLGPLYDLRLRFDKGLWVTRCDPYQLESAVLNIAINARDAMPDGGFLTIETLNGAFDEPRPATPHDVPAGEYVMIRITDTGRGMSPEVIRRAVEPFFTTKPQGQGTGLGLSMVYGFARQSEGCLDIASEPGGGACMTLYLPRSHSPADPSPGPELTHAPSTRSTARVLVVEDEALVRELIVEALLDMGCEVVQATDGPAGLRAVRSKQPFELMISDIGMPGMNGQQLADQALQLYPALKVLMITGYAENATLADGFLKPGMGLMTKPFSVSALRRRVADMLQDA
ncbi:PAS domain S-box-containing protein [Halopseudomonas xinjiangensis]|uniref:histidine kinase n=1 Tax=Halopseudomonas xinjiangensis TaxID=487184 RepID=A0A1H1XM83_9GAMM|nr:PAS domain S-box protein [Halopseudomonas xinjiangensis]SDT10310.1 PAS domain S-box-containing protein [Halopseudomonas xinjiangensis]